MDAIQHTLTPPRQAHASFADMSMGMLVTFLITSRYPEGIYQSELAEEAGIDEYMVARNISMLCEPELRSTLGLGYLTATPDSTDHRKRLLKLTTRGRIILRQCLAE